MKSQKQKTTEKVSANYTKNEICLLSRLKSVFFSKFTKNLFGITRFRDFYHAGLKVPGPAVHNPKQTL